VTRSKAAPEDDFGWWYRFRCLVVFNLLYVAGPAQLEGRNDPRRSLEHEYERRQDLHRERLGKPPLVRKPSGTGEGADPVLLLAVGGGVAVVLLLVWAVLSR